MILGLLLFCCGSVLWASEADEFRERAKALRKKASISAEQGNKEQAERLERESAELLEAAERMELKAKGRGEKGDRPGIDKEVHHLKERLQDLRAKEQKMREANAPEQEVAEVREQIAGTERELQQIHAHHAGHGDLPPEFRAQAEKLEVAGRRIHHLRVAAENLKMAEMHDLAHKLMEQAEAMERDVQEAKQRLAAEMHKGHERPGEHGPDVVRELKDEIHRLRAEVRELRQKVEQK
jgi:DNA repair exonuclease SbcCD ATPase subunit